MLAHLHESHPVPHKLAEELEVPAGGGVALAGCGSRGGLSGQKRERFPEDPGIPHGAAGDHHRVAAGLLQHERDVGRREQVAAADDRDPQGALQLGDPAPVRLAVEHLGAASRVQRYRVAPLLLGDPADLQEGFVAAGPAGADLHREGKPGRRPHGANDGGYLEWFLEERATGAGADDLAHRAPHVDIDQFAVPLDQPGRFGEHVGVVAEKLHADWPIRGDAFQQVETLAPLPGQAVHADHFGEGERGPALTRHEPHREIGDACHGCQENPVF